MMSLQNTVEFLAAEANAWLTRVKRDDGRSVVVTKDGAPEWVRDLCRAAHDGGGETMMPDDWRYEFINDALSALADGAEAAPDLDSAYPYTADRLRWFGSRLDRHEFCDRAVEEFGDYTGGVMGLVSLGMSWELGEVFQAVRSFLADRVEELDAAAADTADDDSGD